MPEAKRQHSLLLWKSFHGEQENYNRTKQNQKNSNPYQAGTNQNFLSILTGWFQR